MLLELPTFKPLLQKVIKPSNIVETLLKEVTVDESAGPGVVGLDL